MFQSVQIVFLTASSVCTDCPLILPSSWKTSGYRPGIFLRPVSVTTPQDMDGYNFY